MAGDEPPGVFARLPRTLPAQGRVPSPATHFIQRTKEPIPIEPPAHICLIASVASTLKVFYRPLIAELNRIGVGLTLIASPGRELDEFRQAGVRTHAIPFLRRISPFRDVVSLVALLRVLHTARFDLIHTHTPKAGLLGLIAGRIARIPNRIHTLHGLPLETARGFRRRLLTATERLTCGSAHTVCVVSQSLRERVVQLKLCPPAKMVILADGSACGVDLSRFAQSPRLIEHARSIRQRLGIPDRATVVGFVGWLVADKGISGLVEVFTPLADARPDLHLLLIGPDGGDRDPLPRHTWEAIRNHPRIHYPGQVSEPAPYYAAMDFCVLPSRREGLPVAVIEAAALGIPHIATRVTGCVDAVVDGVTGLLVAPNGSAELRSAIRQLADDPELRQRLGQAARRRAVAQFPSDRLVAEHLRLYGLGGPSAEE
jgi:glycosyltransferase involved in cell wall biosynthesis